MSLCFFIVVLLRVHVHAHQLGHAANPLVTWSSARVYQLGRVEVVQLLQVVNDSDRSGLRGEGANERRAHEAQS